MISGEFDETNESEEFESAESELDLTEDDSLPWLESDEEEDAGGFDYIQFVGFFVVLLALLAAMVAGIWYLTNNKNDADVVADGSTIEAPDGPYKVKPKDPGGKEFDGTGNVAPGVGEGQTTDGKVADTEAGKTPDQPSADSNSDPSDKPADSAASGTAVGVQVGAYGSEKRAEEGWVTLSKSSAALDGVRYRIVKGQADIGTVYRLQALASDKAAAERLCAAIKADGLNCQVKD